MRKIFKIVIILVIIFIFIYIKNILKTINDISNLRKVIDIYIQLLNELDSTKNKYWHDQEELSDRTKELFNKVIEYHPLIRPLISSIYFDQPRIRDINNRDLLFGNFEKLVKELNNKKYSLKRYYNPLNSLEDLLILPISILKYLLPSIFEGKFSFNAQKTLSTLFWIVGFIANIFSNEIKEYILNLF